MKPFFERTKIASIALNTIPEVSVEVPSCVGKVNPSVEEIVLGAIDKSDWNDNQVRDLEGVIREFLECFAAQPGEVNLIMHDIELTSEAPFLSKAYRVSPKQSEIMKAENNNVLEMGVIREGYSEYCSPLTLVEVPGKGPQPCVEY